MSESNGATATATAKTGGTMGSGTVAGLMAFCDYLIDKGIGPASAVNPLRSAARQVFEIVEGADDVDDKDVRSLDVEEYLNRFQVKAMGTGRYKPDSIDAYRRRFTRIMEYYLTYLTSNTVPKFKVRTGGPATSRKRESAEVTGNAAAPAALAPPSADGSDAHHGGGAGLISYPFPLQSGQMATLRLPVRLERADAERLGTFIRTLVFEPQRELAAGSAPIETDE